MNYKSGDIVIHKSLSINSVTKSPYEFLYEFGYYSKVNGMCILRKIGTNNMQDSVAVNLENIRLSTKEDQEKYFEG